ncbi:MAG: OmpH family outer membrane protein [Gammaproteobacteria bacterium]|nr:OmpH family outer membrane protein [Gammaproteobacteria bacterium]MDH3578311.1 OmpH family outer membrane protein [Gammaproteobacteria bacterium]
MSLVKQKMVKAVFGIAMVFVLVLPAAAQETKIGVVSLPALIERAPQTKIAMDALQEEFAPRQREFLAKQKEFEDLTAKAQKDFAVMGETERRNAEKDLRDLQREVARLQNEFREDLNLRQNEEYGILQRAMLKEVQDYAQQQGYDLIVGDGVLFASTAMNITEQVLRAVEANHQATSAR